MMRAHAEIGNFGRSVLIWVIDEFDGRTTRLLSVAGEGVYTWSAVEEGEQSLVPTLQLDEFAGRAVATALYRLFEGTEDMRQLRRDYEAERKRVDTLVHGLLSKIPGGVA